jgi:hydrogenase/urease accessory protein HupE
MRSSFIARTSVAVPALAGSMSALAHPGADHGVSGPGAALLHVITSPDHLLVVGTALVCGWMAYRRLRTARAAWRDRARSRPGE